MDFPRENTGVIEQPRQETDFVAGRESGILYEENKKDGNWGNLLPKGERQSTRIFDTMACVSFSAHNCLESYCNLLLSQGKFSKEALEFFNKHGYIVDGKFEFSDRFLAKLSGTTVRGNWAQKVADTIRHYGAVPEHMWKFEGDFDWDKYYAEVPQHLIDLGKEFLKYVEIRYEWVPAQLIDIEFHLKQAPLQILTPVCPGWSQPFTVKGCGLNVAHATMIYSVDDTVNIFDHYEPFQKSLVLDYPIPHVLKYVVYVKDAKPTETPVQTPVPTTEKYQFRNILSFGQRNKDVEMLQKVLKRDGVFPTTVLATGYYGTITQRAVRAFQFKHKVASDSELRSVNGMRVGTKTLAKLNELYS